MFLIMLRAMYPGQILGEKTMGKAVLQDFVRVNDYHVAMPVYHFLSPEVRSGSAIVVDDNNRIIPDIQGFLLPTEDTFLQAFDFYKYQYAEVEAFCSVCFSHGNQ